MGFPNENLGVSNADSEQDDCDFLLRSAFLFWVFLLLDEDYESKLCSFGEEVSGE